MRILMLKRLAEMLITVYPVQTKENRGKGINERLLKGYILKKN